MAVKTFSDAEAVVFGWKTLKSNILFFVGIILLMIIVYLVPDIVNGLIKGKKLVALSITTGIVFWVLQMGITLGIIKISLKFCAGEKPEFAELFSCFKFFFKYLAGSVLYTLVVLGGMILLIVPGVMWAVKFQYFPYLIVDKNMGPVQALKKSAEVTRGAKWDLLAFSFVLMIINILGFLALLIGLFAAVPTVMVAYAFVYRRLLEQTEATIQTAGV